MPPESAHEPSKVGRVRAIAVHSLFSSTPGEGPPLTLLDVREPFERALSAIRVPQTVRDLFVPMGEVVARVEEIRDAANDGPIVIYCHHGVRSLAVANWLASQGFAHVCNLEGGIDAWSTEVDPTVPRY